MEKKRINIIIYSLVGFVAVLLIISAYKNLNDHHEKEYLVVHNKIKEAAKNCYLDGKCKGKITLKDLYDKEYLEIQIDPVTKENMNEKICIEYTNKEVKFCD